MYALRVADARMHCANNKQVCNRHVRNCQFGVLLNWLKHLLPCRKANIFVYAHEMFEMFGTYTFSLSENMYDLNDGKMKSNICKGWFLNANHNICAKL